MANEYKDTTKNGFRITVHPLKSQKACHCKEQDTLIPRKKKKGDPPTTHSHI